MSIMLVVDYARKIRAITLSDSASQGWKLTTTSDAKDAQDRIINS